MTYFRSIIRSVIKDKVLSIIRLLSLLIAFAIVIVLYQKISYEKSYDCFWQGHEQIYRVGLSHTAENETDNSAKMLEGAGYLLKEEIPAVEAQCNLMKDVITVFHQKRKFQDVDWYWCDSTFFDIFPRKIIASTGVNALNDFHGVAVSQSFARKVFGDQNPLHRKITLNEGWTYYVYAVFEDLPKESHLPVDVLCGNASLYYYIRNFDNERQVEVPDPNYRPRVINPYLQRMWRRNTTYNPYCYIRLTHGATIDQVKRNVPAALAKVNLPENYRDNPFEFIFEPVADIHLYSELSHEIKPGGSIRQLRFLYLIGLVVLMVSIFNFINLNYIAVSDKRKSYAVRRIIGSKKSGIVLLLAGESMLFTLLAVLLAVPLAYGVTNKMESGGFDIQGMAKLLVVLTVGVVLLSGVVANIIFLQSGLLNRIKSYDIGLNKPLFNRPAMIVFQFVITLVLIITTIGVQKQLKYMLTADRGFSPEQTLYSFTPMSMNNHPEIPSRLRTLRNELSNIPGVTHFSVSSTIPGKHVMRTVSLQMEDEQNHPVHLMANAVSIDDQFLATFKIALAVGENFKESDTWRSNEIVINETAAKMAGFNTISDALGKRVRVQRNDYTIVGVVKDYHHSSLKESIAPTVYVQNLRWDMGVGYYSFRINTKDIPRTMAQVNDAWTKLYPKEEFIYYFTDMSFQQQYENDKLFTTIISISSFLALLISSLGLLGLSLYNTKQRIKEIGVRKVNGARVHEILLLLNSDLLKWIAVAFIISCPLAWYIMDKWLDNFAYKTSLNGWVFAIAGGIAFLIALCTVCGQSWRAANRNPVEALRYE